MRKMLSASALVLSIMLVASSSHAATNEYVGTYTGGLAGAGLWLGNPDPEAQTIVGDFGGYSFDGTEGVPATLVIADATGGIVAYTVAQDLDGDTTAGEAGLEPSVSGCGNGGSLSGSAIPFVEGAPITVFLRSAGRVSTSTATFTPCDGVVTHGTITLTTVVEE